MWKVNVNGVFPFQYDVMNNHAGLTTMPNSTKPEFFNTFKNDHTPSSYLGLTNKLRERKELRIETGRYDQSKG